MNTPTVPGLYERTWFDPSKGVQHTKRYVVFQPGPRKDLLAKPEDGSHSPMRLTSFAGTWTKIEVAA